MSILSALSISRKPAAAFAVIGTFWGCFAAQVPVVKAQIGADDAIFGLMLLGTSFGLLSTIVLAPAIDKRLQAHTLPAACILFACVTLLPGLAASPAMFFAIMIVAGLASGLADVIMNARVSDLEAATKRPLMNANHGVFSVAYALAAVATGLAREAGFGPQAIFAGAGAVILMLSLFTVIAPAADAQEDQADGRFPWAIVLLCGGVVLIAFMTEAVIEQWSALHIERTLGGRAAEGAMGPATLGFTMAVGRFGGQAISERFRDVTVIFWASLMASSGALIASLAATPAVAYLGFGIVGLGVSVIGPLGLALVGRLVKPNMRTKAISRAAVLGFAGFFIAPAMAGFTSELYGLPVAFAAMAVLVLCVLPLIFVLRRRGA